MDGTELSTAVKPQLGCVLVAVGVVGLTVGPMHQSRGAIVPHPWELCRLCRVGGLGGTRAVAGGRQARRTVPASPCPTLAGEGGVSGAPDPAAALVGANTP